MKIALPAPNKKLSPLKSADLLAAQEHASSAMPWWVKILIAICENRLPCCNQSGESATMTFAEIRDIRDPLVYSRDLGAWLSELGYTVVYERTSNGDLPDELMPVV